MKQSYSELPKRQIPRRKEESAAGDLYDNAKDPNVDAPMFQVFTYGNPEADTLLIQMVDDHDLEVIESEVSLINELTGGQAFCLKAVKVNSWNNDLSPWPAPAVFLWCCLRSRSSSWMPPDLRQEVSQSFFSSCTPL